MTNGYILEVKTSSNDIPTMGDIINSKQEIIKNIKDIEDNKNIKEESSKLTVKRHKRKNSTSSCLDKYIKFTVKSSEANKNEEDIIHGIFKCILIFISVGLFWHVLNQVDIIGNLSDGRIRNINITMNININNNKEDSKTDNNRIGEIIKILYLGISVFVVNEIYWRTNYSLEESLIVIRNVGIQIESVLVKESIIEVFKKVIQRSIGLYKRNKNNRVILHQHFIPIENVVDIVINEGFYGMRVITYLSVVLIKDDKNMTELIVVFKNILPRINILEVVYRRVQDFVIT